MIRVQVQAGATGSREAEDRARAVALLGMDAPNAAKANTARTLIEDDLSLFLAYQRSGAGRRAQAALTAASLTLVTHVGGVNTDTGEAISSVFERLGDRVYPRPGLWLLRSPLTQGRVAAVSGARGQFAISNA